MSGAEQRLAEDRGNRTAARRLLEQRLARVRADLELRGLVERTKDRAQEQVFRALDHGIDVARDNKGVVAATLGALALWLGRRPVLEQVRAWLSEDETAQDRNEEQQG